MHEPSADEWIQSANPQPTHFSYPRGINPRFGRRCWIEPRPSRDDVTVVKDATADYSDEATHAALVVNIPNYASVIVSTTDIVAALAAL